MWSVQKRINCSEGIFPAFTNPSNSRFHAANRLGAAFAPNAFSCLGALTPYLTQRVAIGVRHVVVPEVVVASAEHRALRGHVVLDILQSGITWEHDEGRHPGATPDLAFLDLGLVDMDGVSLRRRLRFMLRALLA